MASGAAQSTVSNLRIVLLGRSGSGKSAAGNTILGAEVFEVNFCPEPVTKEIQSKGAEVNGKNITVIDTPENPSAKVKKKLNPGPHVFLLVIRLGVKVGKEQENFVKQIEGRFGADVFDYTIVLFTFKDYVDAENKNLGDFIRESKFLRTLITRCGRRYHIFNNRNGEDRTQVTELLDKIEDMVNWNRGEHYENEA